MDFYGDEDVNNNENFSVYEYVGKWIGSLKISLVHRHCIEAWRQYFKQITMSQMYTFIHDMWVRYRERMGKGQNRRNFIYFCFHWDNRKGFHTNMNLVTQIIWYVVDLQWKNIFIVPEPTLLFIFPTQQKKGSKAACNIDKRCKSFGLP